MAAQRIPIRTGKEIDEMRVACHLARDILLASKDQIRPGVTTASIDQFAAEMMKENECTSAFLGYETGQRGVPPFPGNICISINEEIVHGIGSDRVIQMGDIVKIDVGIHKNGWVGDNAITVPVGNISPAVQKLLSVTEESLHQAIDHARDGEPLGALCASVEEHVSKHGCSVVREFVGHGVGKNLHEPPQVPNYGNKKDGPRLKAGYILAIEPMVNLGTGKAEMLSDGWTVVTQDRKASSHFEHTVLITEGEPEILTPRPRLTAKVS